MAARRPSWKTHFYLCSLIGQSYDVVALYLCQGCYEWLLKTFSSQFIIQNGRLMAISKNDDFSHVTYKLGSNQKPVWYVMYYHPDYSPQKFRDDRCSRLCKSTILRICLYIPCINVLQCFNPEGPGSKLTWGKNFFFLFFSLFCKYVSSFDRCFSSFLSLPLPQVSTRSLDLSPSFVIYILFQSV